MALPRDISGRNIRGNNLLDTGIFTQGDYVVPEFSENGTKITKGQVLGDLQEVSSLAAKMNAHAIMGGAEPLPAPPVTKQAKTAKTAVSKKAAPVPLTTLGALKILADGMDNETTSTMLKTERPVEKAAIGSPSIEVVFSTQLGRIKVNVSAVLDSLNALVLVFANESEIRYEPTAGTNVQLIINGRVENTMYPGFKFPWVDKEKTLMVFVKLAETE